jgi:hypothetical protein
MDDSFKDRSLKLLADPHKLKETKISFVKYDHLKYQLECKFNCEIDKPLYSKLLTVIHMELMIHSVVKDIINQVVRDHNP